MNKLSIILLLLSFYHFSFGGELIKIKDLSENWKFSIGDNMEKKEPDYKDESWDNITAKDSWENQGYNGYDGIAWYRTSFSTDIVPKDKKIYLQLGFIDDADEVYLNGKLIGYSGKFPPHPKTAYKAFRKYVLPTDFLNPNGENVIAVRVYDMVYSGGFTGGEVGLFYDKNAKKLAIDLEGLWQFKRGNHNAYKFPDYNDIHWKPILAPMFWDFQGLRHFNGTGFYRKTVFISQKLSNSSSLYLYLGKIDDFDEVYFNGVLIGSTNDEQPFGRSNSYQHLRKYLIPTQLIKENDYNSIAIRVIDIGHNGGIYEGPLGIDPH